MNNTTKKTTYILFSLLVSLILNGCWTRNFYLAYKHLDPVDGHCFEDVQYKKVPCGNTSLSIYLPYSFEEEQTQSDRLYPVYVYIHGGAWMGGTRDMIRTSEIVAKANAKELAVTKLLPSLRKEGIAVVSISYRFIQQVSFNLIAQDIKDAFSFLKKNEVRYHLDMQKVLIHGESAGAHLALQYGLVDHSKEGITIKAILDLFGPTDLVALSNHKALLEKSPVKCSAMKLVPYSVRYKNSPINSSYNSNVSIFIMHGDIDDLVPFNQSVLLMNKMEALSGKRFKNVEEKLTPDLAKETYLIKVVKNANHGFLNKEVTPYMLNDLYNMMIAYAVAQLK